MLQRDLIGEDNTQKRGCVNEDESREQFGDNKYVSVDNDLSNHDEVNVFKESGRHNQRIMQQELHPRAHSFYASMPSNQIQNLGTLVAAKDAFDRLQSQLTNYISNKLDLGINPEQELLDQVYTQINSEVLPRHLANLDRVLNESKTGWLANTPTPTIADFVFAPRLKWLRSGIDGIPTTVLDGFECITTFLDKFYNLPEIAAYYK